MMKTALSIAQTTMYRMNESAPSSLVTSITKQERQILHLMYRACEEIRAYKCWNVQKRKHTFATTSSRSQYPLPEDFYAPVPETAWNTDEDNPLSGPQNDAEFGWKLYGNAPDSINFSYRIFGMDEDPSTSGGQIELSPTPSSAVNLALEYQSRTFFLPSTYTVPTTPKETVTADTDLCVFDDDLVSLGLTYLWKKENAGDWQLDYQIFRQKLKAAGARKTSSRVGSFGKKRGGPRYRQPYRGWNI